MRKKGMSKAAQSSMSTVGDWFTLHEWIPFYIVRSGPFLSAGKGVLRYLVPKWLSFPLLYCTLWAFFVCW